MNKQQTTKQTGINTALTLKVRCKVMNHSAHITERFSDTHARNKKVGMYTRIVFLLKAQGTSAQNEHKAVDYATLAT